MWNVNPWKSVNNMPGPSRPMIFLSLVILSACPTTVGIDSDTDTSTGTTIGASTTGHGQGTPTTTVHTTGPGTSSGETLAEPPDPCAECVEGSCNSSLLACDGNSECGAIVACIDASPGPCLSGWPKCWDQHPLGKEHFRAHTGCVAKQCYTVCDVEGPCYDQTVACNRNSECAGIFACIDLNCPDDATCWGGCIDQHPTAQAQYMALMKCVDSGCA